MRTVVILGTGTDVGKTYVTIQLAKLLADRTHGTVQAVKPIESGVNEQQITDAERLALVSRPVLPKAHAYAFEPAISPHLAARRAGVQIKTDTIADWLLQTRREEALTQNDPGIPTWLLVETAGGVYSPISDTETNFDLARALEPSCWILVASDALGVLHNVRATILAMRSMGRMPDLVILNSPSVRDGSTGTNRDEIQRLGWANVAASIQRNGSLTAHDASALLDVLQRHFEPTLLNH